MAPGLPPNVGGLLFAQHAAGSDEWLRSQCDALALERDEQLDLINESYGARIAALWEERCQARETVEADYRARCWRLKRIAA